MLRETRKNLPGESNRGLTVREYAVAIEVALKREIGTSRHAVKTLARMTHASERTVQNWLAGVRGPNGVHLILLAQNFASIRSTIIFLAGQGMQQSADMEAVVRLLFEAIAMLTDQQVDRN
ncbi:hypothetical protein [Burkholderia ubonensis]|uniref:hypothetical protein n=1 Tax=Burkholderia ubonensis TaxID=101571 RepID=UPI000F55F4A0|nr:hypothetical protein [Burkholderia ubonensis]RQP36516.1 hypothetical protein DF155_11770 [Burkholderia ubonensis]RQP46652.1 hypothetical protein DF154_01235 [Burkholderia ubonensis]RQP47627.1 hypothetical protein DF156_00665 [Burkholderia ubonensis]RQP61663.1 hypothetical protein DF151_12525 [Burkholderia ubonensis]RQP61881.1 hypothetical protein DF144_00935 [Burkholderia ubonensis]